MKDFQKINSSRILKKEVFEQRAENTQYIRFLHPEDMFGVCNCLIETEHKSKLLMTGAVYPSLGWEHVLVRTQNRYPTHRELIFAKELFWESDEVVFQVYPAEGDNVSLEEYTLHLWRNTSLGKDQEDFLIWKLQDCLKLAKKDFTGTKRTIYVDDVYGKRLLVYSPMYWYTWDQLNEEKTNFLGEKTSGIQFIISNEMDDNLEYVSMIWEASPYALPPKDLV